MAPFRKPASCGAAERLGNGPGEFVGLLPDQITAKATARSSERFVKPVHVAPRYTPLLHRFGGASVHLHILELLGEVVEEVRKAILGIRILPGESHDLEQALLGVAQELARTTAMKFHFIVEGVPRTLHPAIREEIYRIGRESLLNAFRHSGATKIETELHFASGHFGMRIRDNGCGIDPQRLNARRTAFLGLSAMRDAAERIGAQFKVLSRVASGTEVQLSLSGAY